MTETQQRFLRAIAERVPSAQVVEVHLFPPIRQGGVETGVAVVAEDPRRAVTPAVDADVAELPDASDVAVDANDPTEAQEMSEAEADPAAPVLADDAEPIVTDFVDSPLEERQAEDSVEPVGEIEHTNGNGSSAPSRFTIHTARYRLTLKGVDRGKWEVDVIPEADAPLDAVDKVVRGVQRRSGEGAEPDRLTSDQFLEALALPLAQLER